MRTKRDEIDGFRTCGRPRTLDENTAGIVLDVDCPGYTSQPCRIVRVEDEYTFRDGGAIPADAMFMDIERIERSTVRYEPIDGDWSCPECGFEMCAFSPEPRPQYAQVSEQHPDELRRRTLRQDQTAERTATALESAVALLAAAQAPKAEEPEAPKRGKAPA